MLFNSLDFFIFLAVLLPLFFAVNEKRQRILLFWFSLFFYGSLKTVFVPLIFISFAATWHSSLKIQESSDIFRKKIYLLYCLIVNLGILVFFKYTDFFLGAWNDMMHISGSSGPDAKMLGLVLPLGISFYTFQAVAYAVDVYRNKIPAENSFFRFSLFLLFFPQLVAGPIMRAEDLMHQFTGRKTFNSADFSAGATLMAWGFFKKTIVADPIGTAISPVFQNPELYDSASCFLAAFLFAVQIYCDFAGYSDIAIGIGRILGFNIPLNFDRPFFASSITELWRRWHISLSLWLRDYVFISLGGSRVGRFRGYLNLFITMLVGGFWHGANWTFIFWGGINGTVLCLEKYFNEKGWSTFFEKIPRPLHTVYAFTVFLAGAVFFRADSISTGLIFYRKIGTLESGLFHSDLLNSKITAAVLILFIIELLEETKYLERVKEILRFETYRKEFLVGFYLMLLMVYTVITSPQFYYFQF